MKNKKINMFALFLLVLLCGGCTASLKQTYGNSFSRYAPTNEDKKGGVVEYSADGNSIILKMRRENAFKKAYSFCNGPYKIIKETDVSKDSGSFLMYGMLFNSAATTHQIVFECE